MVRKVIRSCGKFACCGGDLIHSNDSNLEQAQLKKKIRSD